LNYAQKAHAENSTGKIITADRWKGASLAPQKCGKTRQTRTFQIATKSAISIR
jgi:hypothetical protein